MAQQGKRIKTKYPGVYFRTQERLDGKGEERVYYIRYRCGGRGTKETEEPVGKESQGMTAAKANWERGRRISGATKSNTERRAEQNELKKSEEEMITVGKLWEIYADSHKENASLRDDKNRLPHLKDFLERPAESLTTADIEKLSQKLFATPSKMRKDCMLSPQSVKHILGLLKRLLNYGNKIGLCAFPAGLVFTMPKVDNEKTETMTKAQIATYLKVLDEEPDQESATILRMGLYTGMRRGAIFGLKWEDIDFEKNFITLRGECAKNGKTQRIPLPQILRPYLQKIHRTESPYVFPGLDGKKRVSFQKIATRVRDKAGLPKDFRPMHALRHVFASQLVSSGENLFTVQKMLTHESPLMTKRYSHLSDEALQNAASKVSEIFSN